MHVEYRTQLLYRNVNLQILAPRNVTLEMPTGPVQSAARGETSCPVPLE